MRIEEMEAALEAKQQKIIQKDAAIKVLTNADFCNDTCIEAGYCVGKCFPYCIGDHWEDAV